MCSKRVESDSESDDSDSDESVDITPVKKVQIKEVKSEPKKEEKVEAKKPVQSDAIYDPENMKDFVERDDVIVVDNAGRTSEKFSQAMNPDTMAKMLVFRLACQARCENPANNINRNKLHFRRAISSQTKLKNVISQVPTSASR